LGSPKINIREIFRVVRFSTFATVSANNGHERGARYAVSRQSEIAFAGKPH
jgi:hypothetical protein